MSSISIRERRRLCSLRTILRIPSNNFPCAVAVRHDVGEQIVQLFGFDFAACNQALPGVGVRYHCAKRVVDFVRERGRQFAHQRDTSNPCQFHVLRW